ncbi:siderophore-interacting protein [Sinorhizobium sp. BG8]|uniref:siderophore-interacting protein n=1 Tax=Sinorhizobium sp. BG8 TaxID=2613773 RepID=UPI001FEE940C|nr:siderophore-interacting protein [Sinorhizobium sp. BG8]
MCEAYHEDYFLAEVTCALRLTPSMTRVKLKVEGHERYIATDHADEWVRLAFSPADGEPVTLPELRDGKWGRFDGSPSCPNRPYTVRRWDPETGAMVVDLVAHEGGVGASWAATAKAGDVIGLCNPEGRYEPPQDAEWVLLLADITGLPAVGRIVEEMRSDMTAIVHVEVSMDADRQVLSSAANLSLTWHCHHGHAEGRDGPSQLAAIARSIEALPDGPGYIYIAGEARCASAARKHFRDTLGFDKRRIDAVGYWIEGQARV